MALALSRVLAVLIAGLWMACLANAVADYPTAGELWRYYSPSEGRAEVAILAAIEHPDFRRVYIVRAEKVAPDENSGVAMTFAISEAALQGSLVELLRTDMDVTRHDGKAVLIRARIRAGTQLIHDRSVHDVLTECPGLDTLSAT